MTKLPIHQIAYSIPGSYLNLRLAEGRLARRVSEGLYLRIVHDHGRRECFKLIPLRDSAPVPFDEVRMDMTPAGVTLECGAGRLYMTFEDEDTCVVLGEGLGLRMDMPIDMDMCPYEYVACYRPDRCLVNSSTSRAQFMLCCQQGRMEVDAPYGKECCEYIKIDFLPDESGTMRLTAEQFETLWHEREYLADARASMRRNERMFEEFCAPFPQPPARYTDTMRLALFTFWSAIVRPIGVMKRRGVYMSNNWMNGIWTWDSAINAMGLSLGDFELALDQLLFPFDYQTPEGLLPDYVSPYDIMWNFTKPPVHGIALERFFIDRLDRAQLEYVCERFARQVDYWLEYTDSDGDGICQYNHGNDCGWDNCTPFEVGAPVEGPDLNAYLVIEMYALEDVCRRLGRDAEATAWREKAEALLTRLLEHSWDGGRFHVYQSGTHRESPHGQSLYPYLPLVLGRRLPRDVFDKLVSDLKRPDYLLTPHGLATESVSSPCYSPDGYWRGPIWAPTMLLLIMGIADGGDAEFARLLADRFCDTCVKCGLPENYNALTGEALRDPAYTWTASAFAVLACRYASQD